MATPITHDSSSSAHTHGVHTTRTSLDGSSVKSPIESITGVEMAFVYSVGPHIEAKFRCGPTMCLPYAISTDRIMK